jgi:hypothetical protein
VRLDRVANGVAHRSCAVVHASALAVNASRPVIQARNSFALAQVRFTRSACALARAVTRSFARRVRSHIGDACSHLPASRSLARNVRSLMRVKWPVNVR